MRILLTLLLLFSTSAFADFKDWTKQDQRLYKSFATLQTMDLIQTYSMIECQKTNPQCPYWEVNPLVGTHPSKAQVTIVKLGLNIVVYNLLDKKLRKHEKRGTLIALNVISLVPVIHNNYIGLGFYIPIVPYRQFR
tara:strand:+ start:63 stop:470 length:408 start_codon:yes stop_codon:yes gene_type:complete